MQTKPMDGQVSIFDLVLPSGKTSPERSAVIKAQTSKLSSKPSQASVKTEFQYLNLKSGGGAGCVVGNGWSIAWRVYDAQYWGVPQRRKRIYLVADFAGERAPEILFEREGVRGNIAQGGEAREGAAADAAGGAGGSGGVRCLNPWDSESKRIFDVNGAMHTLYSHEKSGGHLNGICYSLDSYHSNSMKSGNPNSGFRETEITKTLGTRIDPVCSQGGNVVVEKCYAIKGNFMDRDTRQNGCGWRDGEMYTLDATDRHGVAYPETARALAARHDSSPCVDRGQNVVALAWANSGNAGLSEGDVAPTIKAARNGEPAIMAFCAGGGKASEYDGHYGSISPTIRANAANTKPAVCVGNGQLHQTDLGDKFGALNCMHDQQAVVYPGVGITSPENRSNPKPGDPSCALTNDSRNYLVQEAKPPRKYIVRRLTPTECARLQGFPDEWCEGLGGSDSAIYKAYGNGLALPCAYDVLRRIANALHT